MKGKLPKFLAAGAAKQARRSIGGVAPALAPKATIDRLVPVRPVLPAPRSRVSAAYVSKVAPAFGPARLTAIRAVQAQRDKGRVRAAEASRKEGARSLAREARTIKHAMIGSSMRMTRLNPPSPQADLLTGRLRYSGAFTSSPFSAPFQKSYNARRSFGA